MACTLSGYFERRYLPLRLVGASAKTVEAYRTALAVWHQVGPCRAAASISDIDLARFQAAALSNRSAASVNCYGRHLLAILRHLHDAAGTSPPRWRKLREPKRVPLALTVEEFAKVLKTAVSTSDVIGGIPGHLWWRSLLLACWDTGLRIRAMLAIRSRDFLPGRGLFSQAEDAKDREGQWFFLPPDTLLAISDIYDRRRELLWPCHLAVNTLGKRFRAILDRSGIYAPRGAGMAFHRIRRSKASYTEAGGGDAQKALGHSTRAVTEKYLDPRIVAVAGQVPMPRPA